ncbi:PiggyBac transposable element-derived protein [Trinorchestia longiramus]|nr:PiggyBac transposable element-derived protein [Trinorchestia longiramus]
MPNKCGIENCRGNYNKENRRRVFRLPKDQYDRQKWLDAIPPRENFVIDPDKFFICEIHWGADPPWIKLPGGFMRPGIPPSIFNVPASCQSSPKPAPPPATVEDQQLTCFLQKDEITSFDAFKPESNLQKQYKNLIISRSKERLVCLFMTDNFSECSLSVIVENKPTLYSLLTLSAFKNGISVPLFKTLHPNNGLKSYTQFYETVRLAMNYDIPFDKTIQNVVTLLRAHTSACVDTEKEKKLVFLTRQLELLSQKQFSLNDYCFALQSYPKCNYEQLRDFLVLPCKRKLQYMTSSIDKDQVLRETFKKVQTLQQKNVFPLGDELQIRPTVSFSGGVLSGMAENNRDCEATSMLCATMKSLDKEPIEIQEPKSPPEAMSIKSEVLDEDPNTIMVKEEPIDWNEETQISSSAVFSTFTCKREREPDEISTEALAGHTETHTLRDSSSGTSSAFSASSSSSSYSSTRIKPSRIASEVVSLDCTSDVESDLSDDVLDPDFEVLMQNLSEAEHNVEDPEDPFAEECSVDTTVTSKRKKSNRIHFDSVRTSHREEDDHVFVSHPIENDNIESPMYYFKSLVSDDIIKKICEQTNLFALQNDPSKPLNLNNLEFEQWLGICMQMSVTKIDNTRLYWSAHALNENISQIMSRKRWEDIKSNLHFVDNSSLNSSDELAKVRLLVDHLKEKFKQIPMEENLCVDEQIVPFKGKSSLEQYISKKPNKWGYKIFVLADSKGLVYDFFPYSGKIMAVARAGVPDLGPSSNVVLNLAETIPDGKNHKIYFDDWFTSPKLISHLASRKIWACGSVQETRLEGLKFKSDEQLREQGRGSFDEHVIEIDGVSITAVKWHDNRSVCLASSFLTSAPLHQQEKFDRRAKDRIEVSVPNIVFCYNYMRGTDLHDKYMAYYRMNFRAKKRYFRLIFHLLDMAVVNSYLLLRRAENSKGVSYYNETSLCDFKLKLTNSLIKSGKNTLKKRERSSEESVQQKLGSVIFSDPSSDYAYKVKFHTNQAIGGNVLRVHWDSSMNCTVHGSHETQSGEAGSEAALKADLPSTSTTRRNVLLDSTSRLLEPYPEKLQRPRGRKEPRNSGKCYLKEKASIKLKSADVKEKVGIEIRLKEHQDRAKEAINRLNEPAA